MKFRKNREIPGISTLRFHGDSRLQSVDGGEEKGHFGGAVSPGVPF